MVLIKRRTKCVITLNLFPVLEMLVNVLDSSLAVGQQYIKTAAAAAKSLQSCPTLCDPIDGSPPGSPVPGILQARTLEWVAISFSNSWKWKVKVKSLSRVRLLATPWTAAHQAPLSMEVSRRVLEWGAIAFSDIKTKYQMFQQVFSYLFNSGVIYWGNDLKNWGNWW